MPASNKRFWNPPPGQPGSAKDLFDPTTYVRGAMALQALRQKIGTKPMLRPAAPLDRPSTVTATPTIGEFTDLAERSAAAELDNLFQRWLYQRGKP